jgi:hypothetical protein
MVQRAVKTQQCQVCGLRTSGSVAMDEHIEEKHGEQTPGRWAPGLLTRSKDQAEFRPCLGQTPWGRELR